MCALGKEVGAAWKSVVPHGRNLLRLQPPPWVRTLLPTRRSTRLAGTGSALSTCKGVGVNGLQGLELVALLLAVISHGPPLAAMERWDMQAPPPAEGTRGREERKQNAGGASPGRFTHAHRPSLPIAVPGLYLATAKSDPWLCRRLIASARGPARSPCLLPSKTTSETSHQFSLSLLNVSTLRFAAILSLQLILNGCVSL